MKAIKSALKGNVKTGLVVLLILGAGLTSCGSDDSVEPDQDPMTDQAPGAFALIEVSNGAIDVDLKPTLSWNAAVDPQGDNISYELFLDTNSNPTTSISSNISGTNFTLQNKLPLNEKLFWKVIASDSQGNTSSSDIFSFTTRNLNILAVSATSEALFSARDRHTSIVFDDKMWVIGGQDVSLIDNVWHSTDGMTWIKASIQAPSFSHRNSHASVVFDDKMWVIGGEDGSRLSDVWHSTNGVNWIEAQATTGAAFPGRRDHAIVVFDNKMWAIGGITGPSKVIANDVWHSSDGSTWIEATSTADFSARRNHSSVVFDDKMWVIGGSDGNDDEFFNDVWQSTDGITWTQVTASAPFVARHSHTSVVFDNKMWVIGGLDGVNNLNDVWQSTDGMTWTQVTATAPFVERREHASVVFDDKMWVIGGSAGNDKYNDIWSID